MNDLQGDTFLQQLIDMYSAAKQPLVMTDRDFVILWSSKSACELLPYLALPDGVRQLLKDYDFDKIRAEIEARGYFTTPETDGLFSGNSVTVYALPEGLGYLLHPTSIPAKGTGLRPKGAARAISAFESRCRTPLTMIFSTLKLLKQNYLPELPADDFDRAQEYVQTINQCAFSLLRSCQWISDYSRFASGLTSNNLQRIDVVDYLHELFSAAAKLSETIGISITYELPEQTFPIACDIDKLSTIIYNIISNSLRYTRPGNFIHAKVWRRGDQLVFSIADRGAGISPEVIPNIFEPYFSHSPDGIPFSGNGLGLTIAKSAVASLGGTITLTSQENEGTTVVFTIPVSDNADTPPALFCTAADYLSDRFSKLHVALCDSVPVTL